MTIDRSALTAVLRLAAPAALPFQLDEAVDAALAALGSVTTGDRLPQPAPAAPPAPAEGQTLVEVIEASEREWPDSGLVLSLALRRLDEPDADPIKCRFDAARAVAREIALKALGGLGDGEPVSALVGRQATVETRSYTGRDGIERLGVAKWIVPKKPRAASIKRSTTARRPEPESLPDDGGIPF